MDLGRCDRDMVDHVRKKSVSDATRARGRVQDVGSSKAALGRRRGIMTSYRLPRHSARPRRPPHMVVRGRQESASGRREDVVRSLGRRRRQISVLDRKAPSTAPKRDGGLRMVSFGSGSGRRSKLTYGGRRRGSGSASKARETTPPASRSDKEDETPQAKRVKVKGSDGKGKGTALSGHGGHGKVSDGDVVVDQRGTATTRPSVGKAAAGPASTLGRSKASSSKAGDDSDSSLTDYDEAEVPAPASARAQGSAARKAASSKATKSKHASPVTLNKPTKKTKLSPSASAALAPAVELASHRPSPAKATVASVAHPPLASVRDLVTPHAHKANSSDSPVLERLRRMSPVREHPRRRRVRCRDLRRQMYPPAQPQSL